MTFGVAGPGSISYHWTTERVGAAAGMKTVFAHQIAALRSTHCESLASPLSILRVDPSCWAKPLARAPPETSLHGPRAESEAPAGSPSRVSVADPTGPLRRHSRSGRLLPPSYSSAR